MSKVESTIEDDPIEIKDTSRRRIAIRVVSEDQAKYLRT